MRRTAWIAVLLVALGAAPVQAVHPGTDVIVPAGARGGGVGTSVWSTDLFICNPNDTAATVTIAWLVRGEANPTPTTVTETIGAGQTLQLADVIMAKFGLASAGGAFRITSDVAVMVNAAILNKPGAGSSGPRAMMAGSSEFGQGFEGIPAEAAILAGSTTNVIGLKDGADYRTNIYLIDVSGAGSTVTVRLVDLNGVELASKVYTLGAYQPVLEPVSALNGPTFTDATLKVEVTSGAVIVGASRVNEASGDPLTLNAWWPLQTDSGNGGGGGGGGGGGFELTNSGEYYGITIAESGYWAGGLRTVSEQSAATLKLDTDPRVVERMYLSWFSDKNGCDYIFLDGFDFEPPIPISELFAGKQITKFYDDGARLIYTIQLVEDTPNLLFSGSFMVTGADWPTRYIACNGDHGTTSVSFGKYQ